MKNFVVLLVVILAVSCKGKFTNNSVFEELDKVLSDNPEMVLDSLNTFDPLSFSLNDRAYYYVLKVAAIDKCNKPLPEDSTLYFSQDYYKEKEDLYSLARTQYYIGKSLSIKS
ncbi:MAG: hypothetical protein LIO65_09820, partial [Odoribacter sp.]|nr:hypothetical protein [Odoribacter sp.]